MDVEQRFVENDTFAKSVGIETILCGKGEARSRLTVEPRHLNSAGVVHGGALFSLADAAFSAASNSHGNLALAIDVSISFFKAKNTGELYAHAKEVSLNPRLGTYLIEVRDEDDTLIALFKGTVYRKNTSLTEVLDE